MFQFVIDILVIAAYWGMAITAEGIPTSPGMGTESALYGPSVRPESVLLVTVFLLYLVWDSVEIRLNENAMYADPELYTDAHHPPPSLAGELTPRNWWSAVSAWHKHAPEHPYAREARPMRVATGTFFVLFLMMGSAAWVINPTSTPAVVVVDVLYGLALVLFRVIHRFTSTNAFESDTSSPSEETSAPVT